MLLLWVKKVQIKSNSINSWCKIIEEHQKKFDVSVVGSWILDAGLLNFPNVPQTFAINQYTDPFILPPVIFMPAMWFGGGGWPLPPAPAFIIIIVPIPD